ncbi:hypothetical protein [Fodinicola acaciae]|uniref:hypothetical protein n=1 Tax=Fodinicola acaciae TaxID=2681555 RepID=UPI0013D58770|nr:hypothetical protein [Fodinicola acaciae]
MTVFEIIVVVALLLLVVGMIGMFAMMGELNARVSTADLPEDPTALPIDVRTGAMPARWPAELAPLAAEDIAVLLVVSPLCAACARIAPTVGTHQAARRDDIGFGVVVSCSSTENGADFVRTHRLDAGSPVALDVDGRWLTDEFGVSMSPVLMVFQQGRLVSASTIASLAAVDVVVRQLHEKEEQDGTSDTEIAAASHPHG